MTKEDIAREILGITWAETVARFRKEAGDDVNDFVLQASIWELYYPLYLELAKVFVGDLGETAT